MDIRDLLEKIPFFAPLSREEKESLSTLQHTLIRYSDNECIVEEGSEGDCFFILIRGMVRITKNVQPRKVIALLKSGSIFGEMAYLAKEPRSTHVHAHGGEAVVMRMDQEILKACAPELRDKINARLIQLLVSRINRMNTTLLQINR